MCSSDLWTVVVPDGLDVRQRPQGKRWDCVTHHDRTLEQRFRDIRVVRCVTCGTTRRSKGVMANRWEEYTSVEDMRIPYSASLFVGAVPQSRLVESLRVGVRLCDGMMCGWEHHEKSVRSSPEAVS